ncbi:MAG: hypothetical protein JNK82_18415 [Myxococcaceae bacterium]|nr:hypothetical protein [Myxococcaceae bacterium]
MRSLLVLALLASTAAYAQKRRGEDAPLPYDDQGDDDDDRRRDLPRRSEGDRERGLEETEVERQDREISLAGEDDPNIGISAEVILGANLLDSSRAQGVEPMFMGGIRITWEWSRTLLSDEFWREIFFADVSWFGSTARGPGGFGGTTDIFNSVNYHHFTLAQAFAYPLGRTPLSVYAQGGIGFSYQQSNIYIQGADPVGISAVRFLLQYGLGIRVRIHLVSEEVFRQQGYVGIPCISFRIEVTRFRRAYMDDTFIGASLGITF